MEMKTTPIWTRVCEVADIPRLGSRVLERDSGNIALFRTALDDVFALLDRCPHKGGALSLGIVHGESVTCPLHAWNIDLASGAARAPDVGCAHRFAVRVEDGAVFVCLD
ncbi:MAG: nitrite reductase small subunit NirD [Paraburkholderia sp.]|uniref:nitrite reductase small subunit NirD n=1 Tax=Paraburkholderia sp. TaxID=1926495 RepID=UPI00122BC34B|nr:MAG: nitrite reductase small subunit NirD [Paraburkholderia sp.]TAM30014.1 MAG: nitrite reductase small subunit NirD [Paraburkholderia sp.]